LDQRRRIWRASGLWPELPYANWRDTAATLQLWVQIVGKVRLSLTPWVNHSWQVPLYVTARGLGTSPVPFGNEILEMEFDFISHCLLARTSRGDEGTIELKAQAVADFYSRVMQLLRELGVSVSINQLPSELSYPIRFSADRTHHAYHPAATHRFWRALVQIDRVLKLFRTVLDGFALLAARRLAEEPESKGCRWETAILPPDDAPGALR